MSINSTVTRRLVAHPRALGSLSIRRPCRRQQPMLASEVRAMVEPSAIDSSVCASATDRVSPRVRLEFASVGLHGLGWMRKRLIRTSRRLSHGAACFDGCAVAGEVDSVKDGRHVVYFFCFIYPLLLLLLPLIFFSALTLPGISLPSQFYYSVIENFTCLIRF